MRNMSNSQKTITSALKELSAEFGISEAALSVLAPPVDMVLYNGKVITVDNDFRIVQAVAIRDGKFVAVGNDKEVRACAGEKTKMIDLKGKVVTPGIVDSHAHPVGIGLNLLAGVQLTDITCLKDLFDRLAKAQATAKPGEWITTAANWYLGQVERRPTLAELDAAAPHNPIWLPLGAYEGFTNTIGLQLSGITQKTPDPTGGIVYKDPKTGMPTGHLRGTAKKQVTDLLPPVDPADGLREAVQYFNSIGVTAVEDDGMDYYFPGAYASYQHLRNSGELSVRSVLMLGISESMNKAEIAGMTFAIQNSGLKRGGLGDDMMKVIGLKTVNEDTATGEKLWPRDFLRDVLMEAAKNKVSVRIHSLCAMNEENLGIFQEVNTKYPIKDLRWALVHMHFQTPESIQNIKELGLVINHDLGFSFIGVGPDIWYGQMYGAPQHPNRLIAPVPLYLKEGIPFSLNSDAGGACNQISVWSSVYVACNREKWPSWGDKYGISREESLRAVTKGGAYRLNMEDKIGSIEVGKLADLAILSADPLTCPIEDLKGIKAFMTILSGKIVHEDHRSSAV